MTARLRADGFNPATDRYGVRTYRLVYRTVDAHGRPSTASGLLALPIGGPRDLPVVSFTHGTEVFRGDAPSEQPTGFEPGPAYTYASAGFAVSDPDYLGLGTGPGLHPWMDVPSETTAHVCSMPAPTKTAFVRPLAATGVDALANPPFPSWPQLFRPAQRTD